METTGMPNIRQFWPLVLWYSCDNLPCLRWCEDATIMDRDMSMRSLPACQTPLRATCDMSIRRYKDIS
ncbi:hypothetical protein I7I53_05723 [Histoplasma capsulatum var. duboisii H88]|uniref:Uncharacterized protein n=1 Tax=Ajellomyces capsulatus (strain H88) TaxID=544711 RepID=A0A8A1LVL3_AJEC8|nr:hypothetical protein I7I53_05723 [Histoplasma capsulatum var. duboisii H88]